MVERTGPNFAEMANDLNSPLDRLHTKIEIVEAQLKEIDRQQETLNTHRDNLIRQSNLASHNRDLYRELNGGVRVREEIRTQTARFPLITAINEAALNIFLTTTDPLKLAESLGDDETVIHIPVPKYLPNTVLISQSEPTIVASPMAVIRVGTYGGTSMVLFDQGIILDQTDVVPAVSLHIVAGSMYAYRTEYNGRSKSDAGIVLVQNPKKHPTPPEFITSFSKLNAEQDLACFLGQTKYQTALSLLKPRQ